jgi:hypothetical protein
LERILGLVCGEDREEEQEGAMDCDDARSAIESPQFCLQSMRFLPWRFFLRNFSNRRPPFSRPPFTSGMTEAVGIQQLAQVSQQVLSLCHLWKTQNWFS